MMNLRRLALLVFFSWLAAVPTATRVPAAQPALAQPGVESQTAPLPGPDVPDAPPENVLGEPLMSPVFPSVSLFPRDEQPSHFPHSFYADHPTPGPPDAPSVGQPHYDLQDWRYGTWYRPRSATLTADVRCRCPMPFRPRGYGNLFARPCSPYRMEYDPYVLRDGRNQYGPSYYRWHCDPFCTSHHHWMR